MEQNSVPNQVITDRLADYTHFICHQFGISHDRADGLLREYLELTARVTLPSEQPAGYSELSNPGYEPRIGEQHPRSHLPSHIQNHLLRYSAPLEPYHEFFIREQHHSSRLPPHLQTQSPSYSAPVSRHHEPHAGEETDHSSNPMAMTAPTTLPPMQFSPYDQQTWNNTTTYSDFSEFGAPSRPQTQTLNQTPIGQVRDYDPLWVQKNNVDPDLVRGLRSLLKFSDLFRYGVIKLGDILTFQVSVSANGQDEQTEAHFQITGASRDSTDGMGFPNLSLSVINAPGVQYPDVKTCRGTKAMVEHLQACNITVFEKTWHNVQVIRGQQALGTLWWVKQAFHLWRNKKDQEAEESGQDFRARRAKKRKRT